jgi:glycosyltransferase involved in cell wall biosynthesis
MKILQVSLARRGGMIHYPIELGNAICSLAQVYTITSADVPFGAFDSKVIHFRIDTGKKKLGTLLNAINPRIYSQLVSITTSIKPDLVHMTAQHEWNPIVAWLFRNYLKYPLIYTVFDPTLHEGTPLYFAIPEILVRKIADAYIVQTQWLKEDFVSKGFSSEKTYVIQLGAYSSIAQWKQENIPKNNEILFFGRIALHKGLDTLLKAAPDILEGLPDWKIIIAGSGNFKPYQDLIVSDRIKVINHFIEEQEAAVLFQQAKIVVLPYHSATSTGVIPIAYAFGIPVVATDVGSLRDYVDHKKTGLLIPSKEPDLLAQAVLSLAKDEVYRQQMGQNALSYRKEKLNWSKFAEAHFKVYQDVIERFSKS